MKKRILLIGYNFYPELTGIGKYSGEMILWLAKKGYDCTVLTSYPYYPYWKVQEPYYQYRFWYQTQVQDFASGGRLTIHRCPMYVPAKPSGTKRILLDFSFLITAFFKLVSLLPKKPFDFVVTVVPSFQFGILGFLYKKVQGATILYHIQDMQIEAARDLQMIKSKQVIASLFKLEKYLLDQHDYVSSIAEGMVQKVQEKIKNKVQLFPNWTNNTIFYPIAERDALKAEFGFNPSDILVLYSGAIGEKQGLEMILQSAKKYEFTPNLKFIICGSGPYKEKLQKLSEVLALQNVIFFPLQPFDKFNHFLNMADVHLVIQKADASDLVMPSKLTTILAVGGLALVTANVGSSLHSLLTSHSMGLLVDAENQQAFDAGIQRAISEDTVQITTNARYYADKYLAIDQIMDTFEYTFIQPEVA